MEALAAAIALGAIFVGTLCLVVSRASVSVREGLQELREGLGAISDAFQAPASTRIADLEHAVDQLPRRWQEFADAASRAEKRARAVVTSARRELASHGREHEGLEAEAAQLRLLDADDGGGEPVQPVRESVEGARPAVQDWRAAGLARKFGG